MSGAGVAGNAARLLADVREGKHLAIARAITAIENGTPTGIEITEAVGRDTGRSRSIGVTGPPGAGKSTLINALITEFAHRVGNIGVLTVDPSSALTGGAVLGDRVRMSSHSKNPQVFIRSLASRGHLGGVTRMTGAAMNLLSAARMDLIIVETVGTGQSEIDIRELADLTLVICPPGLGDDMQAIKSGILEVADILVVNKSDLPGAQQSAMHLSAMLHSQAGADRRVVMLTDATRGTGIRELADAIAKRHSEPRARFDENARRPVEVIRQSLAYDCAAWVRAAALRGDDSRIDGVCRKVGQGLLAHRDGVQEILKFVLDSADRDGSG